MKRRTLPLVLGAIALVALAAAFGVSRAIATTSTHPASAGVRGVTAESGSVKSGGCERLMSDPVALKAMQPLHAEHAKDMQAWRDQYGKNTQTAEAQAALKALRQQHVREMRAAFKKAGIKVPVRAYDGSMMDGTNGADMMDGGSDGMMGGGAGSDVHQQHHGGGGSGSSGTSGDMMGDTTGMMGGATF
jgi:hypothetical protein